MQRHVSMKPHKLLKTHHLANSLFISVLVLMIRRPMEVYNVRFTSAWLPFGIVSYPSIRLKVLEIFKHENGTTN